MKSLNFLSLVLICLIFGCASKKVWQISHKGRSGVVAASEKLPRYHPELKKLIPCPDFTINSIEPKSRMTEKVYRQYVTSSPNTVGTNSSLHDPMNNNKGSATLANREIFDVAKETWYEYNYTCKPLQN